LFGVLREEQLQVPPLRCAAVGMTVGIAGTKFGASRENGSAMAVRHGGMGHGDQDHSPLVHLRRRVAFGEWRCVSAWKRVGGAAVYVD
jgi:hypothetical protein